MPNEKIYPTSEEINAPETALLNNRAYPETDQMMNPYADQQATGSYQPPANPDKTAYTYTNPFTNTTTQFSSNPSSNTYDTTGNYTNSSSYPVGGGAATAGAATEEEPRDTASSLCTLCCGLKLW